MNDETNITLAQAFHERAEQQARKKGYGSVTAYIEALIDHDQDVSIEHDETWLTEKLEDGLKSGSAGLLTREKLDALCQEGQRRATIMR